MITYINDENKQNYTVLFEKASTKLGLLPIIEEERDPQTLEIVKHYKKRVQTVSGWDTVDCTAGEVDENTDTLLDSHGNPILPITSLNEYFQHIRDLAGMAIGQGRSGSDPYFLRLPLDEPFFEINANTRGITVPGELSQIAVKGDKLAEIVFFRIDRYYDAVDLNTRHIYIEWELPDGTKGISRDFLRDSQSEKDKLIFGWAIGEELTRQVGAIKFAVRFVEWFDNTAEDQEHRRIALDTADTGTQLLYSFSSLPATVSVVDSLNYSLFENDEALRIYNTEITNENIGTITLYLEDSDADTPNQTAPEPAAYPVFVRDLTDAYYTTAQPLGNNEYAIDLVDGRLELRVEASASDGGYISYVFGRIAHTEDEGTGVAATGAAGIVARIEFIETTDEFDENGESGLNKTYYFQDDNYGTMIVATSDDIKTAPEGTAIYERVAVTEVTAPGHYYAIADNRVSGKKATSTHSSMFYIPWASKPVVSTEMPTRAVFSEKTYTIAADENIGESIVTALGQTNVRVTATDVAGSAATATLQPTVSAEHTNGLTYVWYKHANNHLEEEASFARENYTRPDGLTDEAWELQEAALIEADGWTVINGATAASYVATEPGCYAVKVINDYNNSITKTDLLDAGLCRVTAMPVAPSVNWTEITQMINEATIPTELTVSIGTGANAIDYDEITYQWHKVTYPTDALPEGETDSDYWLNDVENATENDIYNPSGILTFDANGQATIPFVPRRAGTYFIEIRNTLNGATVIYNSGEDQNAVNLNIVTA